METPFCSIAHAARRDASSHLQIHPWFISALFYGGATLIAERCSQSSEEEQRLKCATRANSFVLCPHRTRVANPVMPPDTAQASRFIN
jgi:hypothetical protein